MRIQLITFTGCPHASAARTSLEGVLASLGVRERIEAVDTLSPETSETLRRWGSPTILLDGEDIAGASRPTGPGCRLYRDAEGRMQGWPPEELLFAAFRRAMSGSA